MTTGLAWDKLRHLEENMIRKAAFCFILVAFTNLLFGDIINTTDPGQIAAFQTGATVQNFESISGHTPETIIAYTAGSPISEATAFIFDEITGVQFSVGGAPGTNKPALYNLSGGIAGDAKSATTVLGPVDFDGTTLFSSSALIEIFFPTKVSKVGFWLNPSLGNVNIIALDTNFAFSKLPESTLESANNVTAGNFVGISRPTADIGGFKIIALAGTAGFTIDDFTFGGSSTTTTVPEPGTVVLLGTALVTLGLWKRLRVS
ncbi:MAG: PEP-CTERM sorting domain-containing protein [Candidatus Solibacter usitatus]|nr:PEP-CTERM sorting domain-containing protein [Candidatus Solibacter usitatus]